MRAVLKSAHWRVCDRCLGTIAVAKDNLMGVNCDSWRAWNSGFLAQVGVHVLSGKPREILIYLIFSCPLPLPHVVQATLNS